MPDITSGSSLLGDLNIAIGADASALIAFQQGLRGLNEAMETTIANVSAVEDVMDNLDSHIISKQEQSLRAWRDQLSSVGREFERLGVSLNDPAYADFDKAVQEMSSVLKAGALDSLTLARATDEVKGALVNVRDTLKDYREEVQRVSHMNIQLEVDESSLNKARRDLASFLSEGPTGLPKIDLEQILNLPTDTQNRAMGQFKAVADSMSQFKNMETQLLETGAQLKNLDASIANDLVDKLKVAQDEYTQAMSVGIRTRTEQIAIEAKWQQSLQETAIALRNLKNNDAAASMSGWNGLIQKTAEVATLALGPLSALGSRIGAFALLANQTGVGYAVALAGVAAIGAGLYEVTSRLKESEKQFSAWEGELKAVTGTTTGASEALKYVVDTSEHLGTPLADTARNFANLAASAKGTAAEGQPVLKIFQAITEGSVALRQSQEDLNGTFLAVQQMLSKSVVQSQELVIQLGQRFPGAVNLAAQAMGTTVPMLIRQVQSGTVQSVDFLQKLAEKMHEVYGVSAEEASHELIATLNRNETAWTEFWQALSKSTGAGSAITKATEEINQALLFMAHNMDQVLAVSAGVGTGLLIAFGPAIISQITKLTEAILVLLQVEKDVAIASAAMEAIASVGLGTWVRIGVAVAAAAAAYLYLGQSANAATTAQDPLIKSTEDLLKNLDGLSQAGRFQALKQQSTELQNAIASTADQIDALQNRLKDAASAQQGGSFIDYLTRGLQSAGQESVAPPAVNEELAGMMKQASDLKARLDELKKSQSDVNSEMMRSLDAAAGVSKGYAALSRSLDEIIRKAEDSRNALGQIKSAQAAGASGEDLKELQAHMAAADEAHQMLLKATSADRQALASIVRDRMEAMDIANKDGSAQLSLEQQLTMLIAQDKVAREQIQKIIQDTVKSETEHQHAAEATLKATAHYNDLLSEAESKIDAGGAGTRELQKAVAYARVTEQIRTMTQELEKTTKTADEQAAMIDKLREALQRAADVELTTKWNAGFTELAANVEGLISKANEATASLKGMQTAFNEGASSVAMNELKAQKQSIDAAHQALAGKTTEQRNQMAVTLGKQLDRVIDPADLENELTKLQEQVRVADQQSNKLYSDRIAQENKYKTEVENTVKANEKFNDTMESTNAIIKAGGQDSYAVREATALRAVTNQLRTYQDELRKTTFSPAQQADKLAAMRKNLTAAAEVQVQAPAVQSVKNFNDQLSAMDQRIQILKSHPFGEGLGREMAELETQAAAMQKSLTNTGVPLAKALALTEQWKQKQEQIKSLEDGRGLQLKETVDRLNVQVDEMNQVSDLMVTQSGLAKNLQRDFQIDAQVISARKQLEKLGAPIEDATKKADELGDALRREAQATEQVEYGKQVRDAIVQYDTLDRTLKALPIGQVNQFETALDQLNRQLAIEGQVRAWKQSWLDAGATIEVASSEAEKLRQKLMLLDEEQQRMKQWAQIADPIKTAFSSAFEGMADSIAQAVEEGTLSLQTFKDMTHLIIQAVIKSMLEIALVKPLNFALNAGLNSLGNYMFPTSQPGGAGAGAPRQLFPGGIYEHASGAIISSKMYIGDSRGVDAVGENGEEILLPVGKGSRGQLAPKVPTAGGGGGQQHVTQIFDQRTSAGSQPVQTQHDQVGQMHRTRIFIMDTVKGGVRQGKLDWDMGGRYGVRPPLG
jgi:tape measure domain-containing protein